ncbi:hypothetical protein RND81_08G012200 [Saponaria officinalis]|uniref:Nucleoporin protein Ndc1-Nup n=1 Tax=Saponaria officinalis TaxID=3572 RepID=A0AAW1J267_SAPOF
MSQPATTIIHHRFISFLLWQTIQSTLIFTLIKTLILSPFTSPQFLPSFFTIFSLLTFLFSSLLFSLSLHSLSSPSFRRPASPSALALGLLRLVFTSNASSDNGFVSRARVSFGVVVFVCVSGVSGFVGVVSVAGSSCSASFGAVIGRFGFRGLVGGLVYGLYCVFCRRFVLVFPIVQRPPFFSYKMGLPSAFKQALSLSVAFFLFSGVAVWLLPEDHKGRVAGGFFAEQVIYYIGSFAVVLSSELILHLHKILHTKRFVFAPVKGTAAMETNASEPLLATLEENCSRSLLQYLAYLDLNMVCGNNIDSWRRASFFEETGETYKRVVAVCLRPLEQLASKIAEGLESSADNVNKLSHQLSSPNDIRQSSEILEAFGDFQLYAWCAQAVASLEVHSHKEDRFGVAQLSGSHAIVLSTLLGCLLAVETFMGKKINLQSPNHMLGPAGIKWATNSTARREIATAMSKKRGSPSHLKSYALADVLKTSIYAIVSEFHDEMLSSAKLGLLVKDWVSSGKPVYGSVELLVQKLHFFLNFQAS